MTRSSLAIATALASTAFHGDPSSVQVRSGRGHSRRRDSVDYGTVGRSMGLADLVKWSQHRHRAANTHPGKRGKR